MFLHIFTFIIPVLHSKKNPNYSILTFYFKQASLQCLNFYLLFFFYWPFRHRTTSVMMMQVQGNSTYNRLSDRDCLLFDCFMSFFLLRPILTRRRLCDLTISIYAADSFNRSLVVYGAERQYILTHKNSFVTTSLTKLPKVQSLEKYWCVCKSESF